jgi:hypothetical protein
MSQWMDWMESGPQTSCEPSSSQATQRLLLARSGCSPTMLMSRWLLCVCTTSLSLHHRVNQPMMASHVVSGHGHTDHADVMSHDPIRRVESTESWQKPYGPQNGWRPCVSLSSSTRLQGGLVRMRYRGPASPTFLRVHPS